MYLKDKMVVTSAVDLESKKEMGAKDASKYLGKKSESPPSKVIIRRLPPTMTLETFLHQINPVPQHNYLKFIKDTSLGKENTFNRAYINFLNTDEIWLFKEKFDGYVFLDDKGNEYPAIVEYAPYQKIPKISAKKDPKAGTIDEDEDYKTFLETLDKDKKVIEHQPVPLDKWVEEIELREQEFKRGFIQKSTPLIDYIHKRRLEKKNEAKRVREQKAAAALERRKNNIARQQAERNKKTKLLTPTTEGNATQDGTQSCPDDTTDPIPKILASPKNHPQRQANNGTSSKEGLSSKKDIGKEKFVKKGDHVQQNGNNAGGNRRYGDRNFAKNQPKKPLPLSSMEYNAKDVNPNLKSPIKLLQKPRAPDGDKKIEGKSKTVPLLEDAKSNVRNEKAEAPKKILPLATIHRDRKTESAHTTTAGEKSGAQKNNSTVHQQEVSVKFTFTGNTICKVVTTDKLCPISATNCTQSGSSKASAVCHVEKGGKGRPFDSVEYMKKASSGNEEPNSRDKENSPKHVPGKKERQPIPIYQPGKGIIRTKDRKQN